MEIVSKNLFLTLDFEEDLGSANPTKSFHCHESSGTLVHFISECDLKVTMFITGEILEKYPHLLRPYQDHPNNFQFELHAYDHSTIFRSISERKENMKKGIDAYRAFFGRTPKFYRAPNGMISPEEIDLLINEGLYAGSNFFPTRFPGRFNNSHIPRTPFFVNQSNYFEVPVGVTSRFSVPYSLSYIKLIGSKLFSLLENGQIPDNLVFDFHLHDLFPDQYYKKVKLSPLHRFAYSINGTNKKSWAIFENFIEQLIVNNYQSRFMIELDKNQVSKKLTLA
jgi:uncharacterized protein YegP (UPF0339 family)